MLLFLSEKNCDRLTIRENLPSARFLFGLAGLYSKVKIMKTFSSSLGTPERLSRSIRLLFRSMRPRYNELLLAEKHQTAEGFEYDVYHPRTKPIRTVLMIYGMTIGGAQDVRVIKFARSCANAGLRVVVPHLPGLKKFMIEPGDMQRLESIASRLVRENTVKPGLIGFSTGGSYSLLLAGRAGLRERVGPVVLFSPIYDAREVFSYLHSPQETIPQTDHDLNGVIWGQFVIAYRNKEILGLTPVVKDALQTLLEDYESYDLGVKQAFYQNHVELHNLTRRSDLVNEGSDLELLSAHGQLAGVTAPVFILHDAADRVVPPDQSRRMYAELVQRGGAAHQEILVTPWLSHVVMQTSGSLTELFRIVSFLSELFQTG